MPAAYFWYTEAPRKVSRHSESGGRSWPAPPPKAIAHPFLWPFCAGRTCHPGLRAVIFRRGFARGLFLAQKGTSQSLTAFRVRRTKWAGPTPKAIAHPFLWPLSAGRTWRPVLRVVIFGRGFARGLVLAHGGPSQSLAAFRVRRTNLAPRSSGGYFWAWLCPRPIFGTRRPLAKSHGIPSPADEVGQPHLQRL